MVALTSCVEEGYHRGVCCPAAFGGTLGRAGDYQVAVSANAATDAASCLRGWRLAVPSPRTTQPLQVPLTRASAAINHHASDPALHSSD